uniref:C-type lectin domain-containing protein n=2 Tax=Cyprinus carpio TaxID=7962 RepID=A0A8C1IVY8_CYPCA
MESDIYYENFDDRDIEGTTEHRLQSHCQDEGKARKCRGSRCLLVISMSLGLICVLLLVFIILLYINITAERDLIKSYKNTVEEFNQYQLQNNFSSLSQKNLVLESKVASMSEELKQAYKQGYLWGSGWFFISTELKSWSDSRQYCRDRGADLVIINTEEKQRFITSLVSERVWIGLSDTENEGNMKWVNNSTLKQGFWYQGEPNDDRGNEDCIELMPSFPVLNWNDMSCTDKRKGVCER